VARIDWMYHRKNCETCAKAQAFISKRKIEPAEIVDARKTRFTLKDALAFVRKADQLYASKGQKVVHVNLKTEKPGDDELAALVIGPSGNLRAPSFFVGKTLVVGFNEETYREMLEG
jgi:arsenate reductase-like glutaredoxin family protein